MHFWLGEFVSFLFCYDANFTSGHYQLASFCSVVGCFRSLWMSLILTPILCQSVDCGYINIYYISFGLNSGPSLLCWSCSQLLDDVWQSAHHHWAFKFFLVLLHHLCCCWHIIPLNNLLDWSTLWQEWASNNRFWKKRTHSTMHSATHLNSSFLMSRREQPITDSELCMTMSMFAHGGVRW